MIIEMNTLEKYFDPFRKNTIGFDKTFISPYGEKKIIYADWIASGRLYRPIEKMIAENFGPFVGNTHSEASITGTSMTLAYHHSHDLIKQHVNAGKEDVIITAGSGMTGMVNKFQRILGLRVAEQLRDFLKLPEVLRPVVFITHMEHHSNQTSWIETIADVVVIKPNNKGLVDLNDLEKQLKKYAKRKLKIGSFTACSNVTGIHSPYYEMAKLMHKHDGFCFIDFACSAPYEKIDMHPADPMEKLDAIFFSPHKFLGGPGSSGVLIFDSNLYKNQVPDDPGGGTVEWTNPWGEHKFVNSIETREDGGTPAFLQSIKASLCVKLKEEMGTENMLRQEQQLVKTAFEGIRKIPAVHILADNIEDRLGAISFYVDKIHYNLIVKILNDRYGVQVRGGCSCAGTYGHYLLHVTHKMSKHITQKIDHGDLSEKPGWIRMSIHPTMTFEEVHMIVQAVEEIVKNIKNWKDDYTYDLHRNEFFHKDANEKENIYKMFQMNSYK